MTPTPQERTELTDALELAQRIKDYRAGVERQGGEFPWTSENWLLASALLSLAAESEELRAELEKIHKELEQERAEHERERDFAGSAYDLLESRYSALVEAARTVHTEARTPDKARLMTGRDWSRNQATEESMDALGAILDSLTPKEGE